MALQINLPRFKNLCSAPNETPPCNFLSHEVVAGNVELSCKVLQTLVESSWTKSRLSYHALRLEKDCLGRGMTKIVSSSIPMREEDRFLPVMIYLAAHALEGVRFLSGAIADVNIYIRHVPFNQLSPFVNRLTGGGWRCERSCAWKTDASSPS